MSHPELHKQKHDLLHSDLEAVTVHDRNEHLQIDFEKQYKSTFVAERDIQQHNQSTYNKANVNNPK